ncbi:MAG: hypothetical protein ACPLZD_00890 [Candidatus Saccharicenans sp.]|nr:MAG: hypothetical protein C0168_09615 [Candidatus Aminicenantes bacterium]HEK85166.1 hypothetical protein [Candidatus Aminicenantes bacterium]
MNRALVFLDPRIRLLSALIFITIIIVTYFPAVFWKAAAYLMLMILVFWLISPAKVRRLKNIIKLSWFLISLFAFLALTIYLFSSEKIESR